MLCCTPLVEVYLWSVFMGMFTLQSRDVTAGVPGIIDSILEAKNLLPIPCIFLRDAPYY